MTYLAFDLYHSMDDIIDSKEIHTIVAIISFDFFLHQTFTDLDLGLFFPSQDDIISSILLLFF